MNAPWYDPREIDWQDGLNPLAIPSYREQRNPAVYAALQRPTMVELRSAPGLTSKLYAAPESNYATLGAGSTYNSVVSLPAGAWIVGISASSASPLGFILQITTPDGARLFNVPINSKSITNARPHFLARPAGVPDGGPCRMRLVNQAAVPNLCQLVMWVIQPL